LDALVILAVIVLTVFCLVMAVRWERRRNRPPDEVAEDWFTTFFGNFFR
jgi:hypothetical protein